MQSTTSKPARSERLATALFADRPARIRRPRVAHWEPRLEGTPEEARAGGGPDPGRPAQGFLTHPVETP